MAIPEDHLAKFHKMTDAKEMYEAIKSRFGVSTENVNQKFLRSLPSSWSQVSLIMRTKPGEDTLNFNDLYNNLRVFESDVKGSTGSSSSSQNVAFVSSKNTSSTNEVNTSYSDLEQVDEFDLEEMDLKWQVAIISTRLKKFYKKTGRKLHFDAKELVGFDKSKDKYKAMVTVDGEGVDWTGHAEDETKEYALMACNSSNSGSDTEVMDINKKTKSKPKPDKTEHEMERNGKVKVKVNQVKVKVKDEAKTKEILNGPTRIHLIGRLEYEHVVYESDFAGTRLQHRLCT
nr:hypothetical protein [Tanacetum cinerariifolium]